MRVTGIILIVIGILMMIFTGFNFQEEKKIVNIGPLQVNKKENKHVGWPVYAGAIVVIAGVGLAVAGRKK